MFSNNTRSILFVLALALAGAGILFLGGCASTVEDLAAELRKTSFTEPAILWTEVSNKGSL